MLHFPAPTSVFCEQTVTYFATGKYLPNRMVFFFRRALQESIGAAAAEEIWQSAGPRHACPSPVADDLAKAVDFSCFYGLCRSVTDVYGGAGARSILFRCGRAAITQTLASTSAVVGLEGPHFHRPDAAGRIADGLPSAARLLNILSDMECSMDAVPGEYRFRCAACPECLGRRPGGVMCVSMAGMFRGALDWFGVDPGIAVVETECGNPGCAFSVSTAC
jgi:predicted hydrocarbon binding protein